MDAVVADITNEARAGKIDESIRTCRRRIQALKSSLATQLESDKRVELQVQLRRLTDVLQQQEDALRMVTPRTRSPVTTAIIVIILVVLIIYFSVMLVLQASLPEDVENKH